MLFRVACGEQGAAADASERGEKSHVPSLVARSGHLLSLLSAAELERSPAFRCLYSSLQSTLYCLCSCVFSPLRLCIFVHTLESMEYEWDEHKAASNVVKHGIDFADAATALEDEAAITTADEFADEERLITIGMDALGRLLVVVYTWRGAAAIRLISARRATRHERQQYEG